MRPSKYLLMLSWIFLTFGGNTLFAQYKEIDGLAADIVGQISSAPTKIAAVVDFTDLQGNVTELGRFISEEVSVAMSRDRRVDVVDRTHLKALLQEHKLAGTGIIDPTTARKLGEIAGVQVIITGTITPFGDSVRCVAKALDSATARIQGASVAEIPRTKTIEELLSRSVALQTREVISSPGESSRTSAQPPPDLQVRTTPKPPVVEFNQFRFEPKGCRAVHEKASCSVVFTNISQRTRDVVLDFRGDSLIDDLGNKFNAQSIWFGDPNSRSHVTRASMPPNVPMTVEEVFQGYPVGTRQVTIMLKERTILKSVPFAQ